MIALVCIKTPPRSLNPSPFPSVQSCIYKGDSEKHHESLFWNNRYYIKWKLCINVIIFARFQSNGALVGSSWALPGSTVALPWSTGALPTSSGNDRGSTGMNFSFTWSLPGWSGAHPGGKFGITECCRSVTTTIISPRIDPDHPSNLPRWSWALPGVS
jgi:hypothetical protein